METKTNHSFFIAMSVFVLMAGCLGWWLFLNAGPVAVIPSPTLPKPNAYDDYLAAGNELIDVNEIDTVSNDGGMSAPTPAMKQGVVRKNKAALARIRVGLDETFWNPPVRSANDATSQIASDKAFRRLGYLLKAEGDVKAAEGDWNGAAQAGLDEMKLGSDLPHGAGLPEAMFGNLCEENGRNLVQGCLPHLNALQARSAARRLETICGNRFTFAQTVQEDKWTTQAFLLNDLKHGNTVTFLLLSQIEPAGGVGTVHGVDLSPLLYSKRAVYANLTKAIDAEMALGRLPADKTLSMLPPALPPDAISRSGLPGHSTFEGYHSRENTCELRDIRLMTELALRAYQLDHHAYPETLEQLVPDYLSRVLDNPLSVSGPLRYVRSGTSYVLTHE